MTEGTTVELLKHIYVYLPCSACNGSFEISLGDVLGRHRRVRENSGSWLPERPPPESGMLTPGADLRWNVASSQMVA